MHNGEISGYNLSESVSGRTLHTPSCTHLRSGETRLPHTTIIYQNTTLLPPLSVPLEHSRMHADLTAWRDIEKGLQEVQAHSLKNLHRIHSWLSTALPLNCSRGIRFLTLHTTTKHLLQASVPGVHEGTHGQKIVKIWLKIMPPPSSECQKMGA